MVVLLACCLIGFFLFVGLVNSLQWLRLPGRDGKLSFHMHGANWIPS